jgi:hypothetical protein
MSSQRTATQRAALNVDIALDSAQLTQASECAQAGHAGANDHIAHDSRQLGKARDLFHIPVSL